MDKGGTGAVIERSTKRKTKRGRRKKITEKKQLQKSTKTYDDHKLGGRLATRERRKDGVRPDTNPESLTWEGKSIGN